ncbi:MAG: hypothetical protein JW999_11215 [Methanotrichaceae archaeon]|nr:hypothetical protein [Methanotrichaceae archaeon]
MKTKLSIIIMMFLLTDASADVSFSCSIYNSDDYSSQSISGENITFDGNAMLDGESVSLQGGGSSTSPQSSYSYGLSFNDDQMEAWAQTDSGHLAWGGKAIAWCDVSNASVSSKSAVSDGSLTTNYKNSNIQVTSQVETIGSKFQDTARISPNSIFSQGIGITDAVSDGSEISLDSQERESKGVDQTLLVDGFGKQSRIDSRIYGDTSFQWMSGVNAGLSSFSLGMDVAGRCSDEFNLTTLEMIGSATGFPTQKLPAGRIDIKRLFEPNPNLTIDDDFVEKEIEKFNQENSIDQSLNNWYNVEQTTYVNLTGDASAQGWDKQPGLYYKMKMDFKVE